MANKNLHTLHLILVPLSLHKEMAGHYFPYRDITVAAIPRVGEFLSVNDADGKGQAFEVVAVFHPLNPDLQTTVELRVRHVGAEIDLFKRFNE